MKKWKFSLEAVRLLKNRIEEDAAQKHAQALLRLNRARAELADTEKELNTAALLQFSNRRSTGQKLMQINQYIAWLEKQRRERLDRCLHAEKDGTLARAALEKAAREREILDQLHDHQQSEHRFHIGRQEQKWMDEMAARVRHGLLAAL